MEGSSSMEKGRDIYISKTTWRILHESELIGPVIYMCVYIHIYL